MNWKDMPKLPLVFISLMFVAGAVLYPRLPDVIPTHWGVSGAPDVWSAKSFGSVFSTPLIGLGMYALFLVVPFFDPKRANIIRSKKAYAVAIDGITALLAATFAGSMIAAFDHSFAVDRLVSLGVGLLFIVIGNYMTTVKRNFTMGVRLAWTVMDDVVWAKTNRLGGYLFMGAGVLALLGAFLPPPWSFAIFVVPILAMLPVLYVYSYRLYKQRHPEDMGRPPEPE
ncbi:MAG TPA: SdpI family protein [Coriobacteriia bacterium]